MLQRTPLVFPVKHRDGTSNETLYAIQWLGEMHATVREFLGKGTSLWWWVPFQIAQEAQDSVRGMLEIESPVGTKVSISVGEYLVLCPDKKIRVFSAEVFEQTFVHIPLGAELDQALKYIPGTLKATKTAGGSAEEETPIKVYRKIVPALAIKLTQDNWMNVFDKRVSGDVLKEWTHTKIIEGKLMLMPKHRWFTPGRDDLNTGYIDIMAITPPWELWLVQDEEGNYCVYETADFERLFNR